MYASHMVYTSVLHIHSTTGAVKSDYRVTNVKLSERLLSICGVYTLGWKIKFTLAVLSD